MTHSSPPNPPDSSSDASSNKPNQSGIFQKNILDEWISVLIAFGVIGTVIFSVVGSKSLDWKNPFASGEIGSFSILQDRKNEDDSRLAGDSILEAEEEASSISADESLNTSETMATLDRANNLPMAQARDLQKPSVDQQEEKTERRLNNIIPLTIPGATLPDRNTPETTTQTPSVTKTEPKTPETTTQTPSVTKTEPKTPEATTQTPSVTKTEPKTPEATTQTPSVTKTEPKTPETTFDDVPKEHWAYPFIQPLREKNLILASFGNKFEPNKPITRAGMAELVSHAFQDSSLNLPAKNFNDVSSTSKEFVDINKAVKMGFMKGYSNQKFHPELQIPRYQVLVTLGSGLELNPQGNATNILKKFNDRNQIPDWALDKVAAAVQSDLAINAPGVDFTSLEPVKSATRAEVAAMIYQALVKQGKLKSIESTYIVPYP